MDALLAVSSASTLKPLYSLTRSDSTTPCALAGECVSQRTTLDNTLWVWTSLVTVDGTWKTGLGESDVKLSVVSVVKPKSRSHQRWDVRRFPPFFNPWLNFSDSPLLRRRASYCNSFLAIDIGRARMRRTGAGGNMNGYWLIHFVPIAESARTVWRHVTGHPIGTSTGDDVGLKPTHEL